MSSPNTSDHSAPNGRPRRRTSSGGHRTRSPQRRDASPRVDARTGVQASFRDLGVAKKVNDVLHREGLTSPFEIQARTIPPALDRRDLCGRAPTGAGKTLAFAIPAVENLRGSARPNHPRCLVLTPTRELADQVRRTVQPIAKARGRWVASFYGGTSVNRDIDTLRKGVDIAVATPGRLEDLVDRGHFRLSEVELVILDEADRMADMGFLPVVKRLLDRTPHDRQTLLFSATLDGDVDVLVRRYQRNPVRVEVDADDEEQGDVTHLFWTVDKAQRRAMAHQVLKRVDGSTIVFTRTKHGADRLAKQLAKDGHRTAAIHGNRSQGQRESALKRFSDGTVTTLVATDVAARGIHVDDVDAVLHYDLAGTDKDYVHRSGRTGRAGADGLVVTLAMPEQRKDLHAIQRALDLPKGTVDADLDALGDGADWRAAAPPAPTANNRNKPRGNRPRSGAGGGKQRSGKGGGGSRQRSSNQRSGGNRSGSSRGSGNRQRRR